MNWFVINESEHLGPFEEEVIKQLFKAGDLKKSALLWKEGMSDPKTYEDVFMSRAPQKSEEHLPPELPPEVLRQSHKRRKPEAQDVKEAPKPKEGQKAGSKAGPKPKANIEIEVYEENKSENKKRDFWRGLKFLSGGLVVFFVLVFGWMYYATHFMTFSRPAKMGYNDFERLKKAAIFRGDENTRAFALAKDKSKLWMATNLPYTGEIVLKLSSAPNEILANEPVVLTAKGKLKGRLAEFDSFEFESGQRLIDGWYEIEAVTPRKLEIPLAVKLLSSRNRQFRYIDKILLTTMEKTDFERALKQFSVTQNQNDSAFWEELKQKYETIKAVAVRIHESLNAVFSSNGRDWSQRVDMFEQEYTQNYGSFFTNFVIENEKAYEELKDKDFHDKLEVISNYNRLTRLAKKVGVATMSSLENLRELKSPEVEANRASIRKRVNGRFENIFITADEKLLFMRTK